MVIPLLANQDLMPMLAKVARTNNMTSPGKIIKKNIQGYKEKSMANNVWPMNKI